MNFTVADLIGLAVDPWTLYKSLNSVWSHVSIVLLRNSKPISVAALTLILWGRCCSSEIASLIALEESETSRAFLRTSISLRMDYHGLMFGGKLALLFVEIVHVAFNGGKTLLRCIVMPPEEAFC